VPSSVHEPTPTIAHPCDPPHGTLKCFVLLLLAVQLLFHCPLGHSISHILAVLLDYSMEATTRN
jgi:hypothetical protein